MTTTGNFLSIPDTLINNGRRRSSAIYADVNPAWQQGYPDLLYDAAAVFASLRNLLLCPRGNRSRIFQEDYFCGLYEILQEPFDNTTANLISTVFYQAVHKWEPRVSMLPSDVIVTTDATLPGYIIQATITVNGTTLTGRFNVPVS